MSERIACGFEVIHHRNKEVPRETLPDVLSEDAVRFYFVHRAVRSETRRIVSRRSDVLGSVSAAGRSDGANRHGLEMPWDGLIKSDKVERLPSIFADSSVTLGTARDSRPAAGFGEQRELPTRKTERKQPSPSSDAFRPQKSQFSGAHGRIAREQRSS
jgi:hypothetical protein